MSLNSRGNSPSCGVRTTCGSCDALIASNRRSGASAKLVSASASSTRRALRRQRGQHEIAGPLADAGARPDHAGVEALVGQQFGKFDRRIDGANHHRGQRGGIDRERIARRGQRDEPGACPQARRAPTAAPRRSPRCRRRRRRHGRAHICGRRSAAPETTGARTAGCFRRSAAGFPRARSASMPISATRTRPQ